MTVTAIGASTAAFAAAPNQAEPQTLIATENEDAIWDQIEALEEKSDAVFQRNEALWDKVDEACNALPDDYDFENFDEAAFIRNMTTLTEAEKETLLNDIKELNELDAQMEKLYGQLPACDNMPLYEKALEKADPKVLDEIDTLEQEYDRLCEKNADLWDKVDEAYFNLPDDYDFDNYLSVVVLHFGRHYPGPCKMNKCFEAGVWGAEPRKANSGRRARAGGSS